MTAPSRFRLARRFLGPTWLTKEEGELVGYALDILKDGFVQRLMLGLLARFPEQDAEGRPATPDAQAAQGRDRRVTRGFLETPESYALRLLRWLDDRRQAGSAFALLNKLAEYVGTPSFRTVDARGNWYTRNADGTTSVVLKQGNWNWDGPVGDRWSRFWVIIYPNGLWTADPYEWGNAAGPNWGEGPFTWGSTATADQVQTIRSIVADWKPQGTRCVNIILALDPASFNPASPEPNGLWGRWSKTVAGVQVPARLSTARYWDGV